MAFCVCAGALLKCSFGAAPSPMNVLPANRVQSVGPVACINDFTPFLNILSFGMCQNPSNPAVAAATAAALGVPTPAPCTPVCTQPWSSASQKVYVGAAPALTSDSTLSCLWGGRIQVSFPGQISVQCG